ncbi:MAG: hydrogenobyrinic acid a,c-diamide cobaltochelatase [Candidatus Aramenus sulfurataquae]|uniref:Hydrogenobyrinic acid a,c-diamide cobaltochelatase n=1 Tax=Candidatus Aramenus sulfurataquae TaxID=1326980 RepID=W7KLE9_9CREN|nr:MAG: hydrogenobyrinic acid a,c-diamide cobaltochelatase [Candidatus Aramenus sulfurataquae]
MVKTFVEASRELGVQLAIKYPRLDPIDNEFVESLKTSDAIFIHHFSSENLYSEIIDKISGILENKDVVAVIDPALSKFNKLPPDATKKVMEYYNYGGKENIKNLILYLLSFKYEGIKYEEPKPLPFSGIYSKEGVYQNIWEYLKKYDSGKRVSILFYRSEWVDGDLEIVDKLVEELKREGITPIPVFVQGFGDRSRGIESNEEAIKRIFAPDGKPIVDAIINLLSFSLIKDKESPILKDLNVPIFQGLINYFRSEKEWLESKGLDIVSTIMSVSLPEIDGTTQPILLGVVEVKQDGNFKYRVLRGVDYQIRYMVKRVKRWIELRRKSNKEKKIAIILHSASAFKDLEANIGTATGLDTLQTVVNLMHDMKRLGFEVEPPRDGEELVRLIISRKAIPETKYTSLEEILEKKGFVGFLSHEKYVEFFNSLAKDAREAVVKTWGTIKKGERNYMFDGEKFVIPGVKLGNVLVAVQPKRVTWQDDENAIRLIHNSDLPVHHFWLAFYKWIDENYDVLIHVGTHGTLEFTPGKGVGLSPSCFPQISIGTIPHLYIYAINVPGEGITAKRRSYAVLIDHLSPPTIDEVPDEIKKLEDLIEEYEESEKAQNEARQKLVLQQIMETSENIGLKVDFSDPDKATHEIEHRLNVFKDSSVTKGLHVLGELPDEEDLAEYVLALTKYDEDSMVKTYGKEKAKALILEALNGNFKLPEKERLVLSKLIESVHLEKVNLINALSGGYVEPGPSGSLSRGRYDILPTGRNFFAVDPSKIPTFSAWQIGTLMAERLIQEYLKKFGKYPRAIGFVLWSTDVFRSDGELVAQILHTMGVKPKWHKVTKKVIGVEPIALEELNRPRIDVVVTISGIVRDNLMGIVELIDEAIELVKKLPEDESQNYVKGDFNRIFSAKPGAYGSGTDKAVESSAWKTEEELADVYLNWMAYAYGKGKRGIRAVDDFVKASGKVDMIVHKREIDEIDILDDSCNYSYVGGFFLTCKKLGKTPELMFEDTFNPRNPRIRIMREEIERVSLMKLLNNAWIESQKKLGYRGATEILKKVEHLYGWGATTRMVSDEIFEKVAEKFVLNKEMREWFLRENPWALEEITRRLIEAEKRGIWKAKEETKEALEELYAQIEGESEEW